jgi:hypothetical protein
VKINRRKFSGVFIEPVENGVLLHDGVEREYSDGSVRYPPRLVFEDFDKMVEFLKKRILMPDRK